MGMNLAGTSPIILLELHSSSVIWGGKEFRSSISMPITSTGTSFDVRLNVHGWYPLKEFMA